jgi:hypothetical protein
MPRQTIESLQASNTFNNWLDRTQKLITEVNFLNIAGITGITGGNAIGITKDSDKNYTISFNGNVSGSVTFSGPVTFQSSLSASSINVNSTKLSYSPKVNGLTSGNIVRLDPTLGLTFAKADSADNAEVLGIVVSQDATYNYIAISGQIDNSTFAKTIENSLKISGATLKAGSAYFLSPTVAGGLTTIEPSSYGHVSKPVLLGVTGDTGIILPYRGIIIEGISAGITAELDNRLVISVDFSSLGVSGISHTVPISLGDPVFYFSNQDEIESSKSSGSSPLALFESWYNTWSTSSDGWEEIPALKLMGTSPSGDLGFYIPDWTNNDAGVYPDQNLDWLGKDQYVGAEPIERGRVLGLVSKIVATPQDLGQNKYVLEVVLPGGSFDINDLDGSLDPTFYPRADPEGTPYLRDGSYYVAPKLYSVNAGTRNVGGYNYLFYTTDFFTVFDDSNLTERNKFVDIIRYSPTSGKLVFHYKTQPLFISEAYGGEYESAMTVSKAAIKSAFTSSSGTVTGGSQITNLLPNGNFTVWQRPFSGLTAGGLNAFLTPVADRWFFVRDLSTLTGLTLTLNKQTFVSNQTSVPGSPYYYVDVKTQYTQPSSLENRPRLEHIQKNARLLQGQTATITFWAKSSSSGSTMDLTFNRYNDGIVSDGAFEIALLQRTSLESGITLSTSWEKYSSVFSINPGDTLASGVDGWISFGFEFPTSGATLSIAQVLLEAGVGTGVPLSTKPEEELVRCKEYYQRSYDYDQTTGEANTEFKGNEETVLLGNLNAQSKYTVKLPVRMVETPWEVVLYSPITGVQTEVFNYTAGQDTKNTPGTVAYLPWELTASRTAGLTGNVTVSDINKYGFNINVNSGAIHMDTLKFHWIVDADNILYRNV